jgi:hypothetical protein
MLLALASTALIASCVRESNIEPELPRVPLELTYNYPEGAVKPVNGEVVNILSHPAKRQVGSYESARSPFTTTLLPGEYKLYIYSHADGIQLDNAENFDRAQLRANANLAPIGPLYSAIVDSFYVDPMTWTRSLNCTMQPMSGIIRLLIENNTGINFTNFSGSLNGLVKSRLIADGSALFDEGEGTYNFSTAFDAQTAQTTIDIPCLGIFNPHPDKNVAPRYTAKVAIDISTTASPMPEHIERDITAQLGELMGGAPSALYQTVKIVIEGADLAHINIKISVLPWEDGGDTNYSAG